MRHVSFPCLLAILLVTFLTSFLKAQPVPQAEADSLLRLLQVGQPDSSWIKVYLQLGQYYIYKPGEFPIDLDSAEYYIKEALTLQRQRNDEPGQLKSIFLLAMAFYERGDTLQLKLSQQQAIPLIEKEKDLALQAELWYQLGESYFRSEEVLPDKIKAYERALALYRQMGNQEQEALTLKTIADMHQIQGHYAQSLRELLEVLRIQKSIDSHRLHYTYDLLGHVYVRMGNYELALPYALLAIESAKATADTAKLILFYSRVVSIHKDLNQSKQALEVYQTLLAKLLREPDNDYFPYKLGYILDMSRLMSAVKKPEEHLAFLQKNLAQYPPNDKFDEMDAELALGEAYLGLKNYASAEKHLLESLKHATIISRIGDVAGNRKILAIGAHSRLIKLYLATKQYQKASFYLEQNFQLVKQKPDLLQLSHVHRQAFQLDSLQGNLASAIAHYQQYTALKDSVFNARKSNQLIAYQVQYDTEKKEQDLKLKEQNIALLQAQNKSQQASMEQQQTQRNALIGGTALLLLTLGLGYNRYRLKQHTNKQLETQQSQLQAQQKEISEKNKHLSELLDDKDSLILQKDSLLGEKEGLLSEKDTLLLQQKRLLEEKERLLKEIHHRVKNNLQIVMSLLNSQVATLKDKSALSAIQESQHRVQAMALIHQKLYQSEGIARIPMKAYIEEVVSFLRESYCLDAPVECSLSVEEVELDVAQAVPLGLIINEAITNAYKYAFPDGRRGKISVQLHRKAEYNYQLTIADNGVGLPQDFDPSGSRSLGMTLLHGFSAQLEGELCITSDQGLTIRLAFAEDQLSSIRDKVEYASY